MSAQLDLLGCIAAQAQSAVHLRRVDPARNMARYYGLSIRRNLFGEWELVRAWGRIGRRGQARSAVYATELAAAAALDRQQRVKEQRGYRSRQA